MAICIILLLYVCLISQWLCNTTPLVSYTHTCCFPTALSGPFKALTDSGKLEAEFWEQETDPSLPSKMSSSSCTPTSRTPAGDHALFSTLLGTLPKTWLDAHKPTRMPPCPLRSFPLVLRDLGNLDNLHIEMHGDVRHAARGPGTPLCRSTSLPSTHATVPTLSLQRSKSSRAWLMQARATTNQRHVVVAPSHSPLENLPTELLQHIAKALPDASSMVALRGTSNTVRNALGGWLHAAQGVDHPPDLWRHMFHMHFAALMPTLVGREDTVNFCSTYLACCAALASGRWRRYEGLRMWAVTQRVLEIV